jgi:cullin-associated NEDD8-dissociated protein 1
VSQGRQYKAVVVIFMNGGFDSYNLFTPHSECRHPDGTAKDYFAEYEAVRTGASIPKQPDNMRIPANQPQPCDYFQVHESLPFLRQLYNDGDLNFIANVGALVEPVTLEEYKDKTKELPPGIFAHNIMQRNMHNMDPTNYAAKGVLGRMIECFVNDENGFASDLYSLVGNIKMLEGVRAPDQVDRQNGVKRYREFDMFGPYAANMTRYESDSIMADTWATMLSSSLERSEIIGEKLDVVELETDFADDSSFEQQMRQVSKLIKLRTNFSTERAVFVVQQGGFDTHNTFDLDTRLAPINAGKASFEAEMKAQGAWDDVLVMTVSDFGRTLTSNGQGTDHAWSGNHLMASGSLKGGNIHGNYPSTLTEDNPKHLGRGRMIPDHGWEFMWHPAAEWFGVVSDECLDHTLPNRRFFEGELPAVDDMFNL